MQMLHLRIFTDGSVNTQSKVGYGAYLAVSDLSQSLKFFKTMIKVKRFERTSSTKLELQTLLWALNESTALSKDGPMTITIYSDSQNIISLPRRRARIEQNHYISSKNKRLNNAEMYQEFYHLTNKLNCEFVKVVGHQASRKKNEIDQLFALVDQAARRALREH